MSSRKSEALKNPFPSPPSPGHAHTRAHPPTCTHILQHQSVKGKKGDTFLKNERQEAIISKSYIERACQTGSKAQLQFRPDMCLAIFILISLLRMAADSFCRMSPWEPRWKPEASCYCINAGQHIRRGGGGSGGGRFHTPHSRFQHGYLNILPETKSTTEKIMKQK